jgi:hypothetical protein
MKRILFLMTLIFAAPALAAPKAYQSNSKSTEDCAHCMTKAQVEKRDRDRARIKKDREADKAEIARLRAENERLRNQPVAIRSAPVTGTFRAAPPAKDPKKLWVYGFAGIGPDSLDNDRKDAEGGNEIGLDQGPVLGVQVQYLITDSIGIAGQVLTTTRPENKTQTYTAGFGLGFL